MFTCLPVYKFADVGALVLQCNNADGTAVLQIRCAVVVLVDPTFHQSQLLPSGTNVQTCIVVVTAVACQSTDTRITSKVIGASDAPSSGELVGQVMCGQVMWGQAMWGQVMWGK